MADQQLDAVDIFNAIGNLGLDREAAEALAAAHGHGVEWKADGTGCRVFKLDDPEAHGIYKVTFIGTAEEYAKLEREEDDAQD